jgi:multiple sugar transport system permease protein
MTLVGAPPSPSGGPPAPAGRRPGAPARRRRRRSEAWVGYLFVAPQLLGIAVFVLAPLVALVWFSLHDWNVLSGRRDYVGAANYERLVQDPAVPGVLWASVVFSVGLVALNVTLALLLASLLDLRLRGRTVFRTIFFSPVVVSLVAWSIVWNFLLQDNGGINGILQVVGIDGPNWLREPAWAMTSVIVVQVVKNVGLNTVLLLAARQEVPRDLVEAARLDGASAPRVFRSVVLPMISPTVLLVVIVTMVGSLQVFAQILVLTQGGPGTSTTVLAYYLYQQAFQLQEFGYGSTVAILLFVIVLALTLAQWGMRRRLVFHES